MTEFSSCPSEAWFDDLRAGVDNRRYGHFSAHSLEQHTSFIPNHHNWNCNAPYFHLGYKDPLQDEFLFVIACHYV